MGFMDAYVVRYFKSTPQGDVIYFPYGPKRHAYVVSDQKAEKRLQTSIKVYISASIVSGMAINDIYHTHPAVPLVAAIMMFWLLYYPYQWLTLKVFMPQAVLSNLSFTKDEIKHSIIYTFGIKRLWSGLIMSVAFGAVSIFLAVNSYDHEEAAILIVAAMFCVFGGVKYLSAIIWFKTLNSPRQP